jgi:leucyl aminopeptidase (aminopeptidase T)
MADPKIVDVTNIADKIVKTLLGIKPKEKVLLVADTETEMVMVNCLAAAVKAADAEFLIAIMSSREPGLESHTKLPSMIKRALEEADVAIGLNRTSGAPSYDDTMTRLVKEKRLRYMSMVMRSLENWTKDAATANYEDVYKTAEKLAKVFSGDVVRLTTKAGTDLKASIKGQRTIIEAGFARNPGETAAFSDGEVSLTTVEGTAEGTVLIDGPIAYLGQPASPIKLTVRKGRVVDVQGGKKANKIKEWLAKVNNFDNFAEIGIGVNPNARFSGDWQEEKKRLGNAHIALGDNIYYGGNVNCIFHFDMVLYAPTLYVDGRAIVKHGNLQI